MAKGEGSPLGTTLSLFSRLESISNRAGVESIEQSDFLGDQQIIKDMAPSFVLLGHTLGIPPNSVLIREGHVLVCGSPQISGKTPCIEGLLSRWPGNENKKKKVIVFTTKQEAIFSGFKKIEPYVNTNPDPDFLSLLVESMLVELKRPQISTKINLTMAELCHNAKSLKQVQKKRSQNAEKSRLQ